MNPLHEIYHVDGRVSALYETNHTGQIGGAVAKDLEVPVAPRGIATMENSGEIRDLARKPALPQKRGR